MCIATSGKVVKANNTQADVDYGSGIVRTVVVANHKIHVGDYVLVQMGIIVKILSQQETQSIRQAWDTKNLPSIDPVWLVLIIDSLLIQMWFLLPLHVVHDEKSCSDDEQE